MDQALPARAEDCASRPVPFERCARLPAPGDNVAIATRRLEAGTEVVLDTGATRLPHTVLEGHRFVFEPIRSGEALLSWGLPFGFALRDLAPGEYVCNARILRALAERELDFVLPPEPDFEDHLERYALDEERFVSGQQVKRVAEPGTFAGFRRPGGRGVGTRNFLVVLATTSDAGAFAEALAARFRGRERDHECFDGVVAVTHTEGAGVERPLNLELVLRTLAGFVVHPNVGAVLCADYGSGSFTNADLHAYLDAGGYALAHVPHAFFAIEDGLERALERAAETIEEWVPTLAADQRTQQPLAELRLALQCGGSDAFSGVSGNALAGWVAKELIRHGGAANLAETDELIGAEPYILANVRDASTARRFLDKLERFQERAGWHGANAEGNPSGGNNFRGLYNIALKSIGAARKKDPEVRLDHVLDYGQRMPAGGYSFMDSPGNDLESIAGQVASGANLILFITGNGSITNFPFVPTLKFVTTTGRFELLSNEMDVNAGRYNDGMAMDALGRETFALARRVASGERSKGELAGHSQVSIWRDWRQADASGLEAARLAARPAGLPLATRAAAPLRLAFDAYRTEHGTALDQVGLVVPTSLCSGQVARGIAQHLNERSVRPGGVSRFVALVHTEGCGSANAEELYLETLLGHLRHPFTRRALLLEHGCEKTHNDAIAHFLAARGERVERFGRASVQLDGGIERVRERVVAWFDQALGDAAAGARVPVGSEAMRLGLTATGPIEDELARPFARLAAGLVAAGATVVVPENATLFASAVFRAELFARPDACAPTLAYGETATRPGLHVMQAPTANATETLTGLGGTGVELMLAHVGDRVLQAHPLVPLLQVSADEGVRARFADDLDLVLPPDADEALEALQRALEATASGESRPKLFGLGHVGFQLTRGLLGISL